MATISSSAIILQPLSIVGGSGYPTSGNGYAEVTVDYGDSVIVPIRSGSTGTSAGTSNYGESAVGNTFTGGTFSNPLGFSSFFPTRYITVSNIQHDGTINIWCEPSNGGSNVGWRGRVQVNVNLDTSISLNSSSITMSSSDTSYQNGLTQGGAGTIYYALTVANYPNGSNINSLFAGGDSRFVARTFTTATSKPFSTSGSGAQITNYLPTSSSPSKTVYIYGSNLLGQKSQYLGISYTVARESPTAPTVTANVGIVQDGFGMTSNPSGATNGDLTYRWTTSGGGPNSKSPFDTGWQVPNYAGVGGQNLGVGVEWVGTTWQVQARATLDNGSNYVYSSTSSVTLPTYSISSGPATLEEGDSGTFGLSITNNFGHTLYWQATPTADFITSSTFVGSTSSSGITITPTSGDGTEGSESATLSLYINNTFNALNLVATRPFTITENATTITTPGPPVIATHNNAELAAVTVTVKRDPSAPGANGTFQLAQTTSNSIVGATWYQPGNTGVNFIDTTRGETYYYWARRSVNNVSSATAYAVPFLTDFDSSVTISPSTLAGPSTGNAADGQSATFTIANPSGSNTLFANSVYRLITSNINPAWRKSKEGESDGAADITLLENDGDLPPDGTAATYTYQLSGKRRVGAGGPPNNSESNWTNISGQTVTVQRTVTATEAISASTMNEGASQAFTTANGKLSGLTASTTYYWKVFSPGNGDFSTTQGEFATNSSGVTNGFTLSTTSDSFTENAETAVIRIYTSSTHRNSDTGTGTNFEATASFTINDTSTAGAGGGTPLSPGTANAYGLEIRNPSGNVILSDISRSGTFLDFKSHEFVPTGSATFSMFDGTTLGGALIDCSSKATTGIFMTHWTGNAWQAPNITRSSSGNGITLTRSPIGGGVANGTVTIHVIRY